MDLQIWTKRYFTKDSKVEWPCPNCHAQSLEIDKPKFYHLETAESKKMRVEDPYWEIEWITYIFSGLLTCSACKDSVIFNGIGHPEENGYYDHELDEYNREYSEVYFPSFFVPTLHLFKIPENCPQTLKNEIEDSFKLFWTDLPATANKIRSALEILMNEQKVKKHEMIGGKRKPISLHKRIQNYKHPELIEFFLAVKWIGNTGSHFGSLETIDILEAYKVFEYSLNKIYDNTEKEIKKITQEINKRKGVRKRK